MIKKILNKIFKKNENLVSDDHLSNMAWTVATWLIVKDQTNKKKANIDNYRNDVENFCRLFLTQEKKRGYIQNFNEIDVRYLVTLSLACDPIKANELSKLNKFDIAKASAFEKEIGFK